MKKLKANSWAFVCALAAAACASFIAVLIHSPARAQSAADGKQVYEQICQGCHMPDAKGAAGAGKYPALAGDPALSSRQFMALTVLMGRRNMPAFGAKHAIAFGGPPMSLTDAEIAAVINYVRGNFGNHFKDRITPEEVSALDEGKPLPSK
jgi:mono/diheme cytochrome c family protein